MPDGTCVLMREVQYYILTYVGSYASDIMHRFLAHHKQSTAERDARILELAAEVTERRNERNMMVFIALCLAGLLCVTATLLWVAHDKLQHQYEENGSLLNRVAVVERVLR